jgi:hypothetical protein
MADPDTAGWAYSRPLPAPFAPTPSHATLAACGFVTNVPLDANMALVFACAHPGDTV